MSKNKFAVAVGYNFGLIPEEELTGLVLNPIGTVRFEEENYNLFKATSFVDSRKVDVLLDRFGEYPIADYKIEPVIMSGEVEMVIPGFDKNRDSFMFGAYTFLCEGKEIPFDFSGTAWNIKQEGDRVVVSFETGRTDLLTDVFLDDCYESDYLNAGLRINDITAAFLAKASSISEFMLALELDGTEMYPEDIARGGSFVIKSLSFTDGKDTFPVKDDVLQAYNQSIAGDLKPYRIAITETYVREVEVLAQDELSAQEIAEELCNEGTIDLNYDHFVSRSTESRGPARAIDLQLHEVYDEQGAITSSRKPGLVNLISAAEEKAASQQLSADGRKTNLTR